MMFWLAAHQYITDNVNQGNLAKAKIISRGYEIQNKSHVWTRHYPTDTNITVYLYAVVPR